MIVPRKMLPLVLAPVLPLGVASAGCEEKKPNLAPVASSLAASPSLPPSQTVKSFTIDAESKTTLEMEAPKEKIKAATSRGAGKVDVDLANLPNSRGELGTKVAENADVTLDLRGKPQS
jgi:hypothetical protein